MRGIFKGACRAIGLTACGWAPAGEAARERFDPTLPRNHVWKRAGLLGCAFPSSKARRGLLGAAEKLECHR